MGGLGQNVAAAVLGVTVIGELQAFSPVSEMTDGRNDGRGVAFPAHSQKHGGAASKS